MTPGSARERTRRLVSLSGLRSSEISRSKHLEFGRRAAWISARDRRIHRVVLFRAEAVVQSCGRRAVSDVLGRRKLAPGTISLPLGGCPALEPSGSTTPAASIRCVKKPIRPSICRSRRLPY